jgi:heme A synthase
MVSTNFAGTVCPDFPRCFGSWWPGGTFLISLQMSHRLLGFALAAFIFIFSVMSVNYTGGMHTRRAARFLPALVLLQIILGAINVRYALPPIATLLHLANAIAMFALALLSCFELSAASKYSRESAAVSNNVLVN